MEGGRGGRYRIGELWAHWVEGSISATRKKVAEGKVHRGTNDREGSKANWRKA